MAMSGMQLNEDCLKAYNKLQKDHKNKWVTFVISDDEKEIIVEYEEPDLSKKYKDFVSLFPNDQCKYATFDLDYETSEGQKRFKPIFISWIPDVTPVRKKMVYSSSKDVIKKRLQGIAVEIQANDIDDLNEEDVVNAVKIKTTAK